MLRANGCSISPKSWDTMSKQKMSRLRRRFFAPKLAFAPELGQPALLRRIRNPLRGGFLPFRDDAALPNHGDAIHVDGSTRASNPGSRLDGGHVARSECPLEGALRQVELVHTLIPRSL